MLEEHVVQAILLIFFAIIGIALIAVTKDDKDNFIY